MYVSRKTSDLWHHIPYETNRLISPMLSGDRMAIVEFINSFFFYFFFLAKIMEIFIRKTLLDGSDIKR